MEEKYIFVCCLYLLEAEAIENHLLNDEKSQGSGNRFEISS
jgi:hypothetical protein